MMKAWFSAAEIAAMALPGMPRSKRGVARVAEISKWDRSGLARERQGRGGGLEYSVAALPQTAQAAVLARSGGVCGAAGGADGGVAANDDGGGAGKVVDGGLRRHDDGAGAAAASWAWYETQPQALKDRAVARLEALTRIDALRRRMSRGAAIKTIAEEIGVAPATIHTWLERVRGVARADWLPALVPAPRGGGGREVAVDERFWEAFKADYLRLSEPSATSCYRRVCRIAKAQGWDVPHLRTLRRRVDEIPEAVLMLSRRGRDAAKAMFPAQERDRSGFHALQAVNADGHKWDVFVQWPDGKVSRPLLVAFQDLYSNMFLAWRYAHTENQDAVRLCFGDLIETYGIPEEVYLDNGRAFASKWLSGGVKTRYRFKKKPEEPHGIFKQLGVEVHWTTPYAGQSKPIERGFRDFCADIAKHPAFQGAYCGNRPDAKPEDYGTRAIPIAEFTRIVDGEITEHNARLERRTRVCGGKMSFLQAFQQSYAVSAIRKASAEQRRLCMLAAEQVTVRKDGTFKLLDNRYFDVALHEYRGRLVTVRIDPENVHQDLAVYTQDGRLICVAALVAAVGFADTEAARAHAQTRNAYLRATKEMLAAQRTMSLRDLVEMLPRTDAMEDAARPPETKIIRPIFAGNNALKPAHDTDDEEDVFYDRFARGLRLVPEDARADDDEDD